MVQSPDDHHSSSTGLCNWHAEPENDRLALSVHPSGFAKLKVTEFMIAGKVRRAEIARRNELVETGRILSIMAQPVFLNGLKQGGRGVNGVSLPDNELVFGG